VDGGFIEGNRDPRQRAHQRLYLVIPRGDFTRALQQVMEEYRPTASMS
jgi:hypothetical protein